MDIPKIPEGSLKPIVLPPKGMLVTSHGVGKEVKISGVDTQAKAMFLINALRAHSARLESESPQKKYPGNTVDLNKLGQLF